MKTTEWFPGHIKPVRVGVYQQKNDLGQIGYQLWDGKAWRTWHSDAELAASSLWTAAQDTQNDPWRGLTCPQ